METMLNMRNLKFKSIRAENILCFGPEGVEINFQKYGNIVQLKGINLDAPGTGDLPASNGAGKSSIQEIISIGLFGKTIKSPTKNKNNRILNVLADKGEIEIKWDDFRLIRTFKRTKDGGATQKLDIWQSKNDVWDDDTKISLGKIDETQNFIESKIGLNHHSFCNVAIFDDSNNYSFLEADAATKRQIVENLLNLDQYRQFHQNCKEIQKDLKKKITETSTEYRLLKDNIDEANKRFILTQEQEKNWKKNKENDLKSLMSKIKLKQKELEDFDQSSRLINWQQSQENIEKLNEEIIIIEEKIKKLETTSQAVLEKLEKIKTDKQNLENIIQDNNFDLNNVKLEQKNILNLINDLENLKEGTTCPTCHGIINRVNYDHVTEDSKQRLDCCEKTIQEKNLLINSKKENLNQKKQLIEKTEASLRGAELKIKQENALIKKYRQEISELLKIPKPEGDVVQQIMETEIVELKKQLKEKKEEFNGDSPYKEIIKQIEIEKEKKEKELKNKSDYLEILEKDYPYYDFWIDAFGDNGIRKFIIDGIIPSLNERISFWMQILIDGLIELSFDNTLEEKIIRKGNQAFYHNMSKGEIRRINLAVSQSFSYIMMLSSGSCPSLVFLDEITGGGIDIAGIPFVYNMILELSKERQVFVTTHNESLCNLLQGFESITIEKQNDFSKIK